MPKTYDNLKSEKEKPKTSEKQSKSSKSQTATTGSTKKDTQKTSDSASHSSKRTIETSTTPYASCPISKFKPKKLDAETKAAVEKAKKEIELENAPTIFVQVNAPFKPAVEPLKKHLITVTGEDNDCKTGRLGVSDDLPIASPQLSYYLDDTMQKAHVPYASPILNKPATQEQKVDTADQQNASKPATVPDDNDCKTGAFGTIPKQEEDNQKRPFGGTSNNSVYLPAYHMQPRSN
ncbi:hypothetical protein Ddc_01620 [Ditylenchus destructor]|nr:hypothetical protein Ddc_01620 [Ditylenchus destructor]